MHTPCILFLYQPLAGHFRVILIEEYSGFRDLGAPRGHRKESWGERLIFAHLCVGFYFRDITVTEFRSQTLKMPSGWDCLQCATLGSLYLNVVFVCLLGNVAVLPSWYCLVDLFGRISKAFPELSLLTAHWAGLVLFPLFLVTEERSTALGGQVIFPNLVQQISVRAVSALHLPSLVCCSALSGTKC